MTIFLIYPVAAGVLAWFLPLRFPGLHWDGAQLYIAARALIGGTDPYLAVRNGFEWPLFYPLPAVLLFLPFALLPLAPARTAWAVCSAGLLGYTIGKHRLALLPVAMSAALLDALVLGQYSPLLTAGSLAPSAGFLLAAKPSLGLALFMAYPSRRALVGITAITMLSLVIMPSWPVEWSRTLVLQPHLAAFLRPGGAILILGLLRWRTPECRLVSLLACVPINTTLYDLLPLFLVCRTRKQAYAMVALSISAFLLIRRTTVPAGAPTPPELQILMATWWPIVFSLIWLPALGLAMWNSKQPATHANLK